MRPGLGQPAAVRLALQHPTCPPLATVPTQSHNSCGRVGCCVLQDSRLQALACAPGPTAGGPVQPQPLSSRGSKLLPLPPTVGWEGSPHAPPPLTAAEPRGATALWVWVLVASTDSRGQQRMGRGLRGGGALGVGWGRRKLDTRGGRHPPITHPTRGPTTFTQTRTSARSARRPCAAPDRTLA
jgi:hypothetical protein